MWILFCLLLPIAVAVIVLFTPILISIDTFTEQISLRWGIINASIATRTGEFRYRISAPLYRREGPLEELLSGRRKPAQQKDRSGSPRVRNRRALSLKKIIGSFRVKRFRWDLDTGDPIWNAWLFPAFHSWRLRGHDVRIAFTGRSGLVLTITNNCYRLLKAVFFNQQRKTQEHEQGRE